MTASDSSSGSGLAAAIAEAAPRVPGLLVVFLFGSRLSGRTWAESDLDLGVRWAPGLTLEERMRAERAFASALSEPLGVLADRLDLVDLDRAASSVAFRAIRDGKCVWSHDPAERVRAIVRVARRYDDEAPYRRLVRAAARSAVQRLQGAADGRR